MDWLGQHMRNHLANPSSTELRQNVLGFPGDGPAASRRDSLTAFDLVSQAAAAIREIQGRAADSEARARVLAENAIEKLQHAEARITAAEAARDLAQESLSKLNARLEEAERELARTRSRIAAAEAQLANAEHHMRAAEARAVNAEKAVTQIEDAIRTQLVGLHRNLTGQSFRAA
jgi:chromosome segregation ATPase